MQNAASATYSARGRAEEEAAGAEGGQKGTGRGGAKAAVAETRNEPVHPSKAPIEVVLDTTAAVDGGTSSDDDLVE